MAAPLLMLQDIRLTLGGKRLLDGAELSVSEGERLALVGRNGSGKSSFLKVAAGLIEPDGGDRAMRNGVTLRYLPQEPDLSGYASVRAYVEAGLAPGDDPYRADMLLEALAMRGDEVPGTLSGGEARRAALARVLAPRPDIILLDEPTNHLDLPAIEWLESELRQTRSALVLISHDRRFLTGLSRTTVWLDRGQCRRLDRGFDAFEAWRDEVLEQEEIAAHKLERKIVMEMDWLRYGVSGRRKRNQRRLGLLHDMRAERKSLRKGPANVNFSVADAEISGKLVIEAKGITKAFGGRTIVGDFSIRIARGDRVGVVGANGAGKTTLLKMLTGELLPDTGTVKLGANLSAVTLDQKREALEPNVTLSEALTRGRGDTVMIGSEARHVVSYMKDFLFGSEQANTPVGVLSGGERGRLMLARALAAPANLLVLDEPTNDLDFETLDLLQELLADHPGTVLLVSHDRDFLDRVCTSVILAEGDGRFTEYAGGYSDMVTQRGEGVAARKVEKIEREKGVKLAPVAMNQPKPRLSNQERQALKTLPQRIAQLEGVIKRLREVLAAPDFYAKDPAAFAKASSTLAEAEAQLSAAEDEWLVLEEKREAVEG